VINGSVSGWRLITSSVTQGSVLGLVLFNIYISDIDDGIEGKFVDDTKLSGAVDTFEGREAIQRDLDRLEKWAHENLMRFNIAECKVLYFGWGNSRYEYIHREELIENGPLKKGLVVMVDKKLDKSQKCALAAQKAYSIWG